MFFCLVFHAVIFDVLYARVVLLWGVCWRFRRAGQVSVYG